MTRLPERFRPGSGILPATRTLTSIVLGVALVLAGCGGGGDSDPGAAPGRPSQPDGAVEEPGDTPDTGGAPPVDGQARVDTAPASPSAVPGDWSDAWSTETRTRQGTRPAAELVSARAAAHDGYDRLVLEFRDQLPGYTIGYVASELQQCGSGRPVELSTPHALIVDLSPAAAHDEQGNAAGPRSLAPGLPVLRVARIICDFEGVVEWVVQTERRVPLRVLTLSDPARLVIDLRAEGDGD
jgi:hypothetical protein